MREDADAIVRRRRASSVDYLVGTMIETPRAALVADEIAEVAEFFSFGTNDLTQMTFGFSPRRRRGPVHARVPRAQAAAAPTRSRRSTSRVSASSCAWASSGVARRARRSSSASAASTAAIPASVAFCHEVGLDYVSCSPYRVPIARLAAAHAALGAGWARHVRA